MPAIHVARDKPCQQASSYDQFADLRILDSRLQTFAKAVSRTRQSVTQISATVHFFGFR